MKRIKKLLSMWRALGQDKNDPMPEQSGLNDNYMVDFRPDRFGGARMVDVPMVYGHNSIEATSVPTDATMAINVRADGAPMKTEPVHVAVKPKDVLNELGRIPSNWSLEGLGDKIKMIKQKRELITQHYAAAEMDALLACLENRRKYDMRGGDGQTYREFFSRFDATDQLKIDALCKKHDLVMKEADIFIPEFPADATQVMTDVTSKFKELCGKKPRFFVIANKDQFRSADGKRDPILLVQSPFGFYYYVCGAWDSEMLYLPEL